MKEQLDKFIINSDVISHYNDFLTQYYAYMDLDSQISYLKKIENDKDLFLRLYNTNINKRIISIIVSMKEARDTLYIEELKQIKDSIFITIDRNTAYRCVINKISVILVSGGIAKFIYIVNSDKTSFNLYGNPFYIFDKDLFNPLVHKNMMDFMTDQLISRPSLLNRTDIYQEDYLEKQKEDLCLRSKSDLIDLFQEEADKIDSIDKLIIRLHEINIRFFPPFGFNNKSLYKNLENEISLLVDLSKDHKTIIKYAMLVYVIRLLYTEDVNIKQVATNYEVNNEEFLNFLSLNKDITPEEKFEENK